MSSNLRPIGTIKARLGIEPNGRVQKYFAKACAKAMDKYVPMDNGILRRYIIQGNLIIYEQEYARYQYFGISKKGVALNYHTDKHPLATSKWDLRIKTSEMNDIIKKTEKYAKFWR